MKQFSILFLSTMMICASSFTANAQEARDFEEITIVSDSLTKKLVETLALDATQAEELKTLLFTAVAKEQALEQHLVLMQKALKDQLAKAKEETSAQIEALLDEKQRKLFKKQSAKE